MNPLDQLTAALEGRYRIEREIGRGAMATVFLARDLRHDRRVALKVLSPELGAVLGVERFLAEIRVTANLQHPNLLPLFDSGESSGLLFYVMPYVAGESLRQRIDREKQLPVDEALHIAVTIAGALDYAHRHNVIHRDLKPENILLQDGEPVIADFGIALAVSAAGGPRITHTGLSLGTPQYMSPEQAAGDRNIDGRSDIFALAVVIYEMLAGEPPHLGNTVQAIIGKVLTERPANLRALRPTVPVHTAAAIDRALEKLPADRFSTAHEFAEALQGGVPAVASDSSFASAGTPDKIAAMRRASRHRVLAAMTVLACAAAGIASVGWWRAIRGARQEPVAFTLAFDPGEQPYTYVLGSTVAISPNGRTLAYLAGAGNTSRRLYVRRLAELEARPLPGTELATQPCFSPDGAWLAFVIGTKIQKVTLDGATVVPIADLGFTPSGLSWSADGEIVVGLNGKLAIVSAAGGAPHPAAKLDTAGSSRRWPHWLPGGDAILHTVWKGSLTTSRIAALSLRTGQFTDVGVAGIAPLGIMGGRLIYVGTRGSLMSVEFDTRRLRTIGSPVPVVYDAMPTTDRQGGINAALADAGSLIYVRGVGNTRPVLADSVSTRPLIAQAGQFQSPRYSPDGKYVALQADEPAGAHVWLLEVASGTLTKLTTEGTVNDRAEWFSDSKRVLFRSDRSGKMAVWSQPIDAGSPATKVFSEPNGDLWEALLAPNGRTLIYRTGTTGAADVWYRDLVGDTARRPVAATSFNEWEPRLSPDGRWIAYASDESGTFQVYVRAFPIAGPRSQVSLDGGGAPVWSRDGHRLYYQHESEILSATVSTASGFKVLSRALVLGGGYSLPAGHANFDAGPNGKLLMMKPSAGDFEIVVVHDWRPDASPRPAVSTAK